MREVTLLIGGRKCAASQGATFERQNPISGEIATRAAAATTADCDAAAAAAQAAFPAWSSLAPTERRKRLLKAADLMEARVAEFIEIGVAETGAAPGWYGFNVMLSANMLREAASMTTRVGGEIIPSDIPGNMAMAVRQPCGVILGIAPWNAPVILAVRAIALPLACGNTVILKTSELCPGVHELIGTVMQEAGLGDGVVNIISNAPEDGPAIVQHLIANPAVRRINFTGSTRVGRIIAQRAAEHLKPVLLELGGNNPFIVLDDADMEEAVAGAAFSAFMNQGQICMSAGRIIVDEKIADQFVEKLAAKAKTLKAGNPTAEGMVLGSLISPDAAKRCQGFIEAAIKEGAKVVAGGEVDGAIMQATVVDHVKPGMSIYTEELFGNVVNVVRVKSEEEAIKIANDTEYGLSASVFTKDLQRGMAVAKQIQSGICHVNGPTVHDEAQMPFGGVKDSGYGRFGGMPGVAEFTELRWITLQSGHRHYPI